MGDGLDSPHVSHGRMVGHGGWFVSHKTRCPTGQYLSVPQDKFKHDNMGIPLHLRMSV